MVVETGIEVEDLAYTRTAQEAEEVEEVEAHTDYRAGTGTGRSTDARAVVGPGFCTSEAAVAVACRKFPVEDTSKGWKITPEGLLSTDNRCETLILQF